MFAEVLSFQFVHPAQLVDVLGRGEGHSGLVFISQTAVRAVASVSVKVWHVCMCVLHNITVEFIIVQDVKDMM